MARGRMILRTVGRDKEIADCVDEFGAWAAVLHHRLLAFVDVGENVSADEWFIKSAIFPRHAGMTPDKCRKLADGLVKHGLVIPYEHDGMRYFHFEHFLQHQAGLRVDREKPEYPPYRPDTSRKESGKKPDKSRKDAGKMPAEVKGSEGEEKLREGEGNARARKPSPAFSDLVLKDLINTFMIDLSEMLSYTEQDSKDIRFDLKQHGRPDDLSWILDQLRMAKADGRLGHADGFKNPVAWVRARIKEDTLAALKKEEAPT